MAAEEMGMSFDNVVHPPFNTDTVQESRSPGGSTGPWHRHRHHPGLPRCQGAVVQTGSSF
jgi:hypothetical protein